MDAYIPMADSVQHKLQNNCVSYLYSQVALIVFLSHIGSFVPADAAVVGLTDRYVYAD